MSKDMSARLLDHGMRSFGRMLSVVLVLGACSGKTEGGASGESAPVQQPAASPTRAEPPRSEPTRHLLMVVEVRPKVRAARVLMSRAVELPLPKRRGPAETGAWRVEVLGAGDQVLFTAPLEDASTVRGEFADEKTGELRGVTTQKDVAAVTLRLPWLGGAKQVRVVNVTGGDVELGRVDYPAVMP